ncbi:MAG: acetate/propionate family kinase [Gammaproteobacteria bacterium]|nr:acetate/propionate family kinase [Gammaproteobacteria bacterium]
MQAILVINAGSSTIKFAVFAVEHNEPKKRYTGLIDKLLLEPQMSIKDLKTGDKKLIAMYQQGESPYANAFNSILHWLHDNNIELIAAGHRMIHGATKITESVVLNDEVIKFLETLNPLAPLHQPYNIQGAKIAFAKYPKLFQVACFDTSFHTTARELSQLFALPKWLTEEGVRRYGFHGLSYAYVVDQFENYLAPKIVDGKIIVMHLGNGATMAAIENRKSLATSIGFSAVDGLIMGTRTGSMDPSVILYLMKEHNMGYDEVTKLIYKDSGLLGVSGISPDMRDLLASDSKDAKLAVDLFCYRVAQWIGTLSMELQGLDALVFTAGIGENAAPIREKICAYAKWMGAELDTTKNNANESEIHTSNSKIAIHVIPTDEEATIAKDTWRLLQQNK